MSEPFLDDDMDIELGSNNLFVVPITLRLLTEPCRAMNVDIAYAKEHNIPILPIMLERGIDEIYSRPDLFGELQYLNRYSEDSTEISYEEKLYETQCEAIGDTDGATMNTLNNIVALCFNADDYAKAVIYLAKLHDAQCRTLGELSMPAFDTIDLLCKSCIMVIEKGISLYLLLRL